MPNIYPVEFRHLGKYVELYKRDKFIWNNCFRTKKYFASVKLAGIIGNKLAL